MKKEFIGVIAGKSGEAITKEVHKWGKAVAIVSGSRTEPGVDISEANCCVDLSNKEEIILFFKSYDVSKVILGTGHILAIELAEELERAGMLINISPKTSLLCNDKYALKQYIENIGLHTPKYRKIKRHDDLKSIMDEMAFPVVVKSIRDYVPPQLSHNFQSLNDILEQLFRNEPTVMLEKYIQGNDCSVVVSNSGTEVKALSILYWSKAQEDKLEGFYESFSEPLDKKMEEKVKKHAIKIVEYVNVLGLPRVDIIVRENTPYILEINSIVFSRNSGSLYTISSRKSGIYTPNIIVENAMKYFAKKTGENFSRSDVKLVFSDEVVQGYNEIGCRKIIRGVPEVETGYLLPDAIEKINEFVETKSACLTIDEIDELKAFIGYINKENPDDIVNLCKGKRKHIIELAKEFLNR